MIINLTQHLSSPEQRAVGVRDLSGSALDELHSLLTFDTLPPREDVVRRAARIAQLACEAQPKALKAMIGGASFLISALEHELRKRGISPEHAFSKRESTEEVQKDGSVRKVSRFQHIGFVGVDAYSDNVV